MEEASGGRGRGRGRGGDPPPSPSSSSDTSLPDLHGIEFLVPLYQEVGKQLRLPDAFVTELEGQEPRKLRLQMADCPNGAILVDVVFNGEGHMFLARGWRQFTRANSLKQGYFIQFKFDRDDLLLVKVFDGTMCRKSCCEESDDEDEQSAPTASE